MLSTILQRPPYMRQFDHAMLLPQPSVYVTQGSPRLGQPDSERITPLSAGGGSTIPLSAGGGSTVPLSISGGTITGISPFSGEAPRPAGADVVLHRDPPPYTAVFNDVQWPDDAWEMLVAAIRRGPAVTLQPAVTIRPAVVVPPSPALEESAPPAVPVQPKTKARNIRMPPMAEGGTS